MTTDWFDEVKTELLAQNPFRGSEYFRRFAGGALAREQAWGHVSQWYFLICWFPRMFSGISTRASTSLEVCASSDCAHHLLGPTTRARPVCLRRLRSAEPPISSKAPSPSYRLHLGYPRTPAWSRRPEMKAIARRFPAEPLKRFLWQLPTSCAYHRPGPDRRNEKVSQSDGGWRRSTLGRVAPSDGRQDHYL